MSRVVDSGILLSQQTNLALSPRRNTTSLEILCFLKQLPRTFEVCVCVSHRWSTRMEVLGTLASLTTAAAAQESSDLSPELDPV